MRTSDLVYRVRTGTGGTDNKAKLRNNAKSKYAFQMGGNVDQQQVWLCPQRFSGGGGAKCPCGVVHLPTAMDLQIFSQHDDTFPLSENQSAIVSVTRKLIKEQGPE